MKFIDKLLSLIINNDIAIFSYKFEAGPYFMYVKKHFCFKCGQKLKRKNNGHIAKTNDKEEYDFEILDAPALGNAYITNTVFKCDNCGKEYSVEDLKYLELSDKKKNKIKLKSDILEKRKKDIINLLLFIIFTILILIIPLITRINK